MRWHLMSMGFEVFFWLQRFVPTFISCSSNVKQWIHKVSKFNSQPQSFNICCPSTLKWEFPISSPTPFTHDLHLWTLVVCQGITCALLKRASPKNGSFYSLTLNELIKCIPALLFLSMLMLRPSASSLVPVIPFVLLLFSMKERLCAHTVFIQEPIKSGLKEGKQHFTISLLIHPLTVKGCLNRKSPTLKERPSIVLALRGLQPFTFIFLMSFLFCHVSFV